MPFTSTMLGRPRKPRSIRPPAKGFRFLIRSKAIARTGSSRLPKPAPGQSASTAPSIRMSRTSSPKQRFKKATFEVANSAVYGVNAPNTSFTVNSGAILQGGIAGTVAINQFTLQSGATLNIAGNAPAGQGFSVFTIDAAQASFESRQQALVQYGAERRIGATHRPSGAQPRDRRRSRRDSRDEFRRRRRRDGRPRRHPTGRGDQRRHDDAQ